MHASSAFQKQALVRRDSGVVAEQVLQYRSPSVRRMRALRNLGELERIAQQHDVARGRRWATARR